MQKSVECAGKRKVMGKAKSMSERRKGKSKGDRAGAPTRAGRESEPPPPPPPQPFRLAE